VFLNRLTSNRGHLGVTDPAFNWTLENIKDIVDTFQVNILTLF